MKQFRAWKGKNFHRIQLEHLCDFLDELPYRRFDYGRFVGPDWKGHADLSCGTTACAFGWAATLPIMKMAGLRLTVDASFSGMGRAVPKFEQAGATTTKYIGPFQAAAVAFGIPEAESLYLFGGRRYLAGSSLPDAPPPSAPPKEVAEHIRRYLAWKKWPSDLDEANAQSSQ